MPKRTYPASYLYTRLLFQPLSLIGVFILIGLNIDFGLPREQPATVRSCAQDWIMCRSSLHEEPQLGSYYRVVTDRGEFAYDTSVPVNAPITILSTRFTQEPVRLREADGREGVLPSTYTRFWFWPVGLGLLSLLNLSPRISPNARIAAGMGIYFWLIMTLHFFDVQALLPV